MSHWLVVTCGTETLAVNLFPSHQPLCNKHHHSLPYVHLAFCSSDTTRVATFSKAASKAPLTSIFRRQNKILPPNVLIARCESLQQQVSRYWDVRMQSTPILNSLPIKIHEVQFLDSSYDFHKQEWLNWEINVNCIMSTLLQRLVSFGL